MTGYKQQNAMIRFHRIDTLSKMARKGATEYELMNKALSMGVTLPTAQSYIRTLYYRGYLD